MPLNIRSEDVNALADKLARRRGVTKTEAVRQALLETLELNRQKPSVIERLDALAREFRNYPRTGLEADKAFYDELSGDE